MRSLHRILPAAALALAATAPLSAGWAPVGGPVSPVVTLQLDPSRPELLYAQTLAAEDVAVLGHYLWRSEDAGATWRDIQPGLERPVMALAIDPEDPRVIWAWASEGSLWRSGDAGDTWSLRSTFTSGATLQVLQLLVDPHHPDTLYRVEVASASFQVLVAVSRDGGMTFTKGAPFTQPNSVFKPVIAPPDRDELLAFAHEGLRVSTDGGRSWQLRGLFRGAGFSRGVLAPSAPDTLYGIPGNNKQCLARSDDDGAHWRLLSYPPRLPPARAFCYDVAVDPRDSLHVWVAAELFTTPTRQTLLFESRNGGASWSNPIDAPSFGGVVAAGGERLYTGDEESFGLYTSADGGHTWTADHGIVAGDLRDGLVAQRPPGGGPGRRLVALNTPLSVPPDDDLYHSDGGQTWLNRPPLQAATIAGAGGSVVLEGDNIQMMRSRDGGTTWTAVPTAPQGVQAFRSDPVQPQYPALLAADPDSSPGHLTLWTSDDAGATWHRSSEGLPIACSHTASGDVCPAFPAYAVDPFNPSRRWVSNYNQEEPPSPRIFVTEDAGATWHLASSDLSKTLALAADPTIPGRLLAGTDGGLFASGDGGLHWSPLGDLPDGAVIRQFAWDPLSASWYAATVAHGIYRSLDGGAHWTLLAGAPDHDNPTIAVDPRRPTALLAAFAGQGLWRWTP
jgi:photosystem II stability/assembly factor-like uncharacterized protein